MNGNEPESKCTSIYMAYIMTVYVWYVHYKYYDIMQAKRMAFLAGTVLYVTVVGSIHLYRMWKAKKTPKIADMYAMTVIALIFSWLLSLNGAVEWKESVLGYGGKCTGILVYVFGLLAAWFISKYLQWSFFLTWILVICSIVVSGLQILNRWGIDPFHMYDDMAEEQIRFFISTIGQVNYNASFDCMVSAIIMCLFLTCKEKQSQIVYGICLLFVYIGAICCCADSVYLGLAVNFIIIFCYTLFHVEKWNRFVKLLVLLDVAVGLVWFTYNFVKRTYLWDLSEMLVGTQVYAGLTWMMLIFVFGGTLLNKKLLKKQRKIRNPVYIGLVIIVLFSTVAFLVYQKEWEYWRLMLSWVKYRGEIWKRAFQAFANGTVWQKLFGYGFNNVTQALKLYSLEKFGDMLIADMHNIVLNTLVTSGIIGLALWGELLIVLLRDALGALKEKENAILVICGIMVYLFQGMVNGPQILTTPLFLVELGVFMRIVKNQIAKTRV